jgi:hypothetical protein
VNGHGAEEGTYTQMVIMQDHVPVARMYRATGTRYAVVMHGIEDIGDRISLQLPVGRLQSIHLGTAICLLITVNYYMRSGTSIPNNAIARLITLADDADSCRRNCFRISSSACSIDFS